MTDTDDTMQAIPGDDPETTGLPTGAAQMPDLAWSAADEPESRQSWRSTWGIAGLTLLSAAVLTTTVVGLWAWPGNTPASRSTSTPVAVPTVSAEPTWTAAPPVPTSVVTQTVTPPETTVTVTPRPPTTTLTERDNTFFHDLIRDGLTIKDPSLVITTAHKVCAALAGGQSRADIADQMANADPSITFSTGDKFVIDAQLSYCPQL